MRRLSLPVKRHKSRLRPLVYSIRENGLGAIDTRANKDRWKTLSPRQRDDVRARVKRQMVTA